MALTFDDVVEGARQKTGGLPDPDSDSWRIGLEILLRDHAKADFLNERGWTAMRARYVDCLATRMQVDEFIRKNPEVTKASIKRPVFILGMPRTGTTMVSYLMDADPGTRSILKWEAYNVVPPAATGTLKTDTRCLAEVAKDQQILKAHPAAFASHYEAGDGPTECVHLVAQDFRSLMLAVLSTTPTYHDWILMCEMATAFAHRKRVLQILQSTNPGRWVLKMPSDALFIRTLFETFPDARVIWTHRDPYATFASSVSMRTNGRRMFNKDPDFGYVRQRFPLQMALHVMRPLQMSRERPEDIYNLYYEDLVANPIAAMKKVYAWLGDAWTGTAEARMQQWLRENPQGRFGAHTYKLEDWGLSNKDLVPYFHDYLKVHPVAKNRGV
jgi:Sulfotransferase family